MVGVVTLCLFVFSTLVISQSDEEIQGEPLVSHCRLNNCTILEIIGSVEVSKSPISAFLPFPGIERLSPGTQLKKDNVVRFVQPPPVSIGNTASCRGYNCVANSGTPRPLVPVVTKCFQEPCQGKPISQLEPPVKQAVKPVPVPSPSPKPKPQPKPQPSPRSQPAPVPVPKPAPKPQPRPIPVVQPSPSPSPNNLYSFANNKFVQSSKGGGRRLTGADAVCEEILEYVQEVPTCCEEYQVSAGEDICAIAERFELDCQALRDFNDVDEITEGQIIQVC